jgi:hypothetical protein
MQLICIAWITAACAVFGCAVFAAMYSMVRPQDAPYDHWSAKMSLCAGMGVAGSILLEVVCLHWLMSPPVP